MNYKTLGIDIGSTTVKIAILDENENLIFADYKRHFANIQETLADLLQEAFDQYGEMTLHPVITGSGGLTLANHLGVPFTQEVIAVSTSLQKLAPKTDVAIELHSLQVHRNGLRIYHWIPYHTAVSVQGNGLMPESMEELL